MRMHRQPLQWVWCLQCPGLVMLLIPLQINWLIKGFYLGRRLIEGAIAKISPFYGRPLPDCVSPPQQAVVAFAG